MPVNEKQTSGEILFQRIQYAKGGIGRLYWDYRDKIALSSLKEGDQYIIDVGCGEGITLEKLKRMLPASQVLGIDCLQDNVNICLKTGLPALRGDIYSIDIISPNSVDAVLLLEVIEHLEQPERALRKIWEFLKPGGKIIIVFPNDKTFMLARIFTLKFREALYDPGHVKQWHHGELINVLHSCGFSVRERRSIPFYFWPLSLHGVLVAVKV
jgi:2-polyprenyl-3-methyl-5-hydroxy-6-metoxy-1,4-benzoquinol methylase